LVDKVAIGQLRLPFFTFVSLKLLALHLADGAALIGPTAVFYIYPCRYDKRRGHRGAPSDNSAIGAIQTSGLSAEYS
jgi:hypothetical protein